MSVDVSRKTPVGMAAIGQIINQVRSESSSRLSGDKVRSYASDVCQLFGLAHHELPAELYDYYMLGEPVNKTDFIDALLEMRPSFS